MTKPLVSVLMPVYNAASTVEAAASSLLRQTHDDFEIVTVDDGSTDGTVDAVKQVLGYDSRLRLIESDHLGLVNALNIGLAECQGEFIARMDGDDICHPERLRLQVEHMLANPELSVISCLVRSFPWNSIRGGFRRYEIWLNSIVNHDGIVRDIFVESPVAHPSVMLRTSELRQLGGYIDHGWPEDYDLWLRYFTAGKRFEKVPLTLLFWRSHAARLTFTDTRYSLENFIRAKAHYLAKYLSKRSSEIILWGAGMTGRRLSKHLVREGIIIKCVVDVDPKKISRTMRGIPIVAPEALESYRGVFIIAAVGSERARELIREHLCATGRIEMQDFLCAA